MSKKTKLKALEELVGYFGRDNLNLIYKVDHSMKHLLSKSMKNYLELPIEAQLLVSLSHAIAGKMKLSRKSGNGFVFQMSNGTQQVKRYEPEIYKNNINTPLRLRSRKIMQTVMQDYLPDLKTRMRQLFRDYPYHLQKTVPINLRLKNFYFERGVLPKDRLIIYKTLTPDNPNPLTDTIIFEKDFYTKKTAFFEYSGIDEEYYYALNQRSGERSNLLHFIWEETIEG